MVDEISKQVSINKLARPPMIESASPKTPSPSHIELTVPRHPERPKQAPMSRQEMQNTIMWARKDEIDTARSPKPVQFLLSTKNMNKSEKNELLHDIVNSAQQELAEDADPSIIPMSTAQIEQQRLDQADQIQSQVLDLEDMEFKASDLKQFTNRH